MARGIGLLIVGTMLLSGCAQIFTNDDGARLGLLVQILHF